MRYTGTLIALAATAVLATACSDSNAPATGHVGRYDLVSLNGESLPAVLADDPTLKVTVTAGTLTLNANSTFTQDATLEIVANGFPDATEHLSCGGTYRRSGSHFTMTGRETDSCTAMTATGILAGNTLTVSDDEGETLVFRR